MSLGNKSFEILLSGQFREEDLLIEWDPGIQKKNKEFDDLVDRYWKKIQKNKGNKIIYDGALCRLVSFEKSGRKLIIKFGPTSYKELIFSNSNHQYISKRWGYEYLSNGTAVCTTVKTQDRKLIIQERSCLVFENPGYYHVCGGNINPTCHLKEKLPDPFSAMRDELKEELNIFGEHIISMKCLALIRNLKTFKPEFIFDTSVNLDFDEILLSTAKGISLEYSKLIGILDEKKKIERFLISNKEKISPPGYAALWLHSKNRDFWRK